MDWSAIFAGLAALASVFGLVYSVRKDRDNLRKEFLLWAIDKLDNPSQREARKLVFEISRDDERREALLKGIRSEDKDILHGEELSKVRTVFALFNYIGYFWIKLNYGKNEDAKALFPQMKSMWEKGLPIITAIRGREANSFNYFQSLYETLYPPD